MSTVSPSLYPADDLINDETVSRPDAAGHCIEAADLSNPQELDTRSMSTGRREKEGSRIGLVE